MLADHRGFCYGVERAVKMAEECVGIDGNVATLGPIIHNPQVVKHLTAKGIGVVSTLRELESGTVIIRSHGAGPGEYRQAAEQGLKIVDATCPHVSKAQAVAREQMQQGYQVVVVGEKNHPEVKSIIAWTDDTAQVVETSEEAERIQDVPRLGIVAQTTFPPDRFEDIVRILKTKSEDVVVGRTVCRATELRQQAAVKLAAQCDVMVVVGGKNSANTSRLAELCRLAGTKVYHVETAAELEAEWFRGAKKAGITAGASTPDWLIEEVYQKMQEFDQDVNQEISKLEAGNVIKGTVVGVRHDEVFVDIGYKAEGVITLAELAFPQPEKAADVLNEGDVIDVYVMEVEGNEEVVKLSKIKADSIVAWDKLEQTMENKQPVEGKVLEVVKGGLSVSVFGVRGFVPASQLDLRFVADLAIFAGQTLSLLPIEIDRSKQRVVLSRRVILEEERRKREDELFAKIAPNQVVKGIVRRLTDFGVFVDIGGVDGLIHISDLAWHRVKSPAEIVNVGDEVEVVVLKVDTGARKISLSLKAVSRDPWFDMVDQLHEGQIVQGKVTKLSKFGAFVEVARGIEGLVHLSELDDRRVSNPDEVVHVGQEVPVKILSIDKNNKRVSLSIAQAKQEVERAEYSQYLEKDNSSFGFTIGDKLGHLFKHED
jgi:4-hydroxy-3-methylbut-2-enyl diphosphate reductase